MLNILFRPKIIYKLFCVLLLCFSNLFILSASYAKGRDEVQVVYLEKIADYTTWSTLEVKNEMKSFNLCILGEDNFNGFLQSYYDKKSATIKNKPVNLFYFDNIKDIPDCHLLFISNSKRKNVSEILGFIKGRPILSISNIRDFTGKKGMIQLYMQGQIVRFKINNKVAINHGLNFSSELLRLAVEVDR